MTKDLRWVNLRSSTIASHIPEVVARSVDRAWVTDSLEVREEAFTGAPEIAPAQVLTYMGTDIYLQRTPTAKRNVPQVWAAIWKTLRPEAPPGQSHISAHGKAPKQAAPPSRCLPPHGPGAYGD